MRFIKYIFILSCLLPAVIFSLDSTDLCPSSFSNHREFVRSFFSDSKNINLYEGQKGYVEFVEEYLNSLHMNTVFKYASSVLSKNDMENLSWQVYFGTTKEFQEERLRILDGKRKVKKEYQSVEGYIRYANEFHRGERKEFGDMYKAYVNVSAVLSKLEKKSLDWRIYQGTTKEFRADRLRILDDNGEVKEEYRNLEGYVRYSNEFYNGVMQQVYVNISAVLSESEKKNLNWKTYKGTTDEFREERVRVLDEKGTVKKEYRGPKGYIRYADEFYNGDMFKTYLNVLTVLNESEKKNLNWQAYQGITKEFREERSRVLDEKGKIKKEYQDPEGHIRYADEFYNGDMFKSYKNVSAVLSELEKKSLNWQAYRGTTKEFRADRSVILDNKGDVKEEYQGPEGHIRYADEFYNGDMFKAYANISAVLSESEKKSLNWQSYKGTTDEFQEERSRILDEKGKIKEEYQGVEGHIRYADEFYNGDMYKAYMNVSAVLSKSEKKNLNWKTYKGTTDEFREDRSRILDEKGKVKKEYRNPEGYIRYADEFYGGERKEFGDMFKSYTNVSAVLSWSEKKGLNWQVYSGTTGEFRADRLRILDEEGNIKEEYQGPEGHIRYADEFYNGDMKKSYQNISAVLSKSEKKNLNWKTYKGTTKEFREERLRVLDEKGNIKEEYQDIEGCAHYADEFYGGERKEFGDMFKAYTNVSAVLSESEKKSLNWQSYQGTTKEFRAERSRVLDDKGNVKKEYKGIKGNIRYADKFYNGDMLKNYINVSAALSKEEMKKVDWKMFFGDTGQIHSLFEFFKNHSFEDYRGGEGQKKIAKMIFKDHLKRTYMNVSTLRNYLFNDGDEFKDLRESGWSLTLSW